jgi:hypothetical protein
MPTLTAFAGHLREVEVVCGSRCLRSRTSGAAGSQGRPTYRASRMWRRFETVMSMV